MSSVMPQRTSAPKLSRHVWTVESYHQMAESGLLNENDRIELIEGELLDMPPIGSKHANWVANLAEAITLQANREYKISIQNPVVLGPRNEPQPDVMLLKKANYMNALPTAADVLLIVEVSDSTLEYDRDVKLGIYARHSIPEVWLLDVNRLELLVYREPADGQYRLMRICSANDVATSVMAPNISVRLNDLLG
jgi:Uma2 family endonuclease